MMARRRWPSATPALSSTKIAPASGPRWRKVDVIVSMHARASLCGMAVSIPVKPHIALAFHLVRGDHELTDFLREQQAQELARDAFRQKIGRTPFQRLPVVIGCKRFVHGARESFGVAHRNQAAIAAIVENFRRPAFAISRNDRNAARQRLDDDIAEALSVGR